MSIWKTLYAIVWLTFLHLVTALAIITQASSVATAFDMGEEHEYAPQPQIITKP